MPARTQLFQMMPWTGGLNLSQDAGTIAYNQLVVADNVIFAERTSKKSRDGIDHNWDSNSNGTNSVIGEHDFWFGSQSRTQRLVSITDDRKVYSYNSGTATQLSSIGTAWSGTLGTCSFETFNNLCMMGVDGSTNTTKVWDGNTSDPVRDLYSKYTNTAKSRSSSSTTRTLVFNETVNLQVGATIVIDGAGNSAYNGTFTIASFSTTTVSNDTITYTGTSSLTESSTPDTGFILGQLAPKANLLRNHQGRLLLNDKTNPDRIHFSPTFDHTLWWGNGDSGAIDLPQGDGDPEGITGFISFKGILFVWTRTKLYRVDGDLPDYTVQLVSDGIGCVSHTSIAAIDTSDLFWVSDRGVHSLSSTATYGDFESQFVSLDIQKKFNEGFDHSRFKNIWAAYNPNINSVAFTFTENDSLNRQNTTNAVNNAVWLYNIPQRNWYRWPDLSCQSLIVASDSDTKRFYLGTHYGRISRTFSGHAYDVTKTGANTAILFKVKTGQIFLDQNPYAMKAFKRFILYFRPSGTFNLNAIIKIDNQPVAPENILLYTNTDSGGLLGSTFILGTSVLGYEAVFSPYSLSIDGVGRSIEITIQMSSIDGEVDLQGFGVEFEPAGTSPMTYVSNSA